MAARLPPKTLNFKQFLVRRQVLTLYREIMKTLKEVPNAQHREDLKVWARDEFKQNKNEKDEASIQHMIYHGQQILKEIASSLAMAK
ncbi:LYR motif-containing protein 2-like [Actinia tenebrosa]|uniref:LYR motif-containing protein 2 n=1 Tax=Actinia tenebrosa TaxID=6105 RepID=A0A6P8HZ76_ACTTE|nr:LYR motif-containing protein 2-like [Actinia tenebrosa]